MVNNKGILSTLYKVDNWLATFIKIICAILMIAIVLVVTINVITRFVFFNPLNFGSGLSKYLMIWIAFLGIGLAAQNGEHIAVDMFLRKLKGKSETFLLIIINVVVSIFLIFVIYYGFIYAISGSDSYDPLVFDLNMMIPYSALPIGAVYTFIQYNIFTLIQILERS